MLVLGIHDGHDAGACLIQDGKLLLHSSEERRRNSKNYAGIPDISLKEIFRRTGVSPQDVDLIALGSQLRTTFPTRGHKPVYSVLNFLSWAGRSQTATRFGRWLLSRLRKRKELMACLESMGMGNKTVLPFDHHLCHAATAYYFRPWQGPATVLTLDGAGDGLCATVNKADGPEIHVISQTPKYHSPAGWMYSALTAHLGMRPYEHEYKLMGMAPYGDPDFIGDGHKESVADILRRSFGVEGLEFRNKTGHVSSGIQAYYKKRLYARRFDNVAAACQLVFEEMMLKWVKNAIAATGVRKIATAGGAFLNVKANKLIRELPEVEAMYTFPASDDGGTPIGAALLGYAKLCKDKGTTPRFDLPKDMYLGLGFTDEDCEKAAKASGMPFRKMANVADEAAQLLTEGKIIGRFSGREEVGPRALGNRSLLADARDLRVIRKLNFAIKQRDFWMPFAASVLEEDAPRYIKNLTGWAYYMIEAFDTTPAGFNDLCAGTHPFDQTIRPQLVNELNPEYRDLIRAFKARTGVGGLLNTSFNLHGSPIVGTPEVAIDTLARSELDAVVLGSYLISKKPRVD
ncbi:MAG: carbamoyltransferase C-terminal domain-containing protein [Gemmatales bacterium]